MLLLLLLIWFFKIYLKFLVIAAFKLRVTVKEKSGMQVIRLEPQLPLMCYQRYSYWVNESTRCLSTFGWTHTHPVLIESTHWLP